MGEGAAIEDEGRARQARPLARERARCAGRGPRGRPGLESARAWLGAIYFCGVGAALGACRGPQPSGPWVSESVRGPLGTRIQHPLALTHPSLPPRSARVPARGLGSLGLDLAYSSLYRVESRGDLEVDLDSELARVEASAEFGLGGGHALALELALLGASDGFLDGFVSDFHELFNLPDPVPDSDPPNEFSGSIDVSGKRVYALEEDCFDLADTHLEWIFAPSRGLPGWDLAWRLGLDLPTGEVHTGYGNGELEWALGIALERAQGRFTHFVGASWVDVRSNPGFEDLPAGARELDFAELSYAIEYRYDQRSSLLGGLFARTPLVDGSDLDALEHPIVDLGLGYARDLQGRWRFVVSFHEDLLSRSGPDFTLRTGLRWVR